MTYLNTYIITKILLSVGTYWCNLQAYYAQHIKIWSMRRKYYLATHEQSAEMTLEAKTISISRY